MAEQLNLEINIGGKGQVVTSLGEIKKAIKDAEFQALALSEQFGETDKRVIELREQIGKLKDTIEDSAAATKNYAGSSAVFPALAKSVQGVASGFAAVQGAIGLLGVESQEVEKSLLKVQSALALSQGLGDLIEAKDAFINLGGVIKGSVTKAFGTLKSAIISTGIGALVVALGLLIANFDEVKKYLTNLFPALAKLGEFFTKITNAVTDFVGITSEAERQLEKFKKTSERTNEEINNRIKLLTAQGGKEKEVYELSQQLIENDLNIYRKTISAKGKLSEEDTKKFRELQNEKAVLQAGETKRIEEENKKQVEENKKRNEEILKQNEEARQKALELEGKRRDDVKNIEKEINAVKQETARVGLDERDAELLAAQQELDDNLILYKDNLDAKQKAYQLYDAQIKLINANAKEEDKKLEEKQTEDFYTNLTARATAQIGLVSQLQTEKEKAADYDIKLEKAKSEAQIGLASQTLDILSGLIDKNSVAGKAIAISQAIINTYQGASKALAQGGIFGSVAAAATIAAGLVNVNKIISTKVPSAKGSGDIGSAGGFSFISSSAPITPQGFETSTTNLSQSSINALGNQAIRAYVVETDITSNQQRITAIKQRARFN
jgi:low affinity Fe/Cu permease